MSLHFQNEVSEIKNEVSTLATLVEENLHRAVRSVKEHAPLLAQDVVERDRVIDHLEIRLEENVLKVLALHQPVAADLRYLVTVLKLNEELERIGDLAVNIANHTLSLQKYPSMDAPYDFGILSQLVCQMLKKSLDAIIQQDRDLALEIKFLDDRVDDIHRNMYSIVKKKIVEKPQNIDPLLHYLSISKCLESIADRAEAMAADIIYMLDGKIVRHQSLTKQDSTEP